MKKVKLKVNIEIAVIISLAVLVFSISSRYDMLEDFYEFTRHHEEWELDEIIPLFIYLVFALLFFSIRRWIELRKAMNEIKQLQGIIPICSVCKNIRDDEGYWHKLEAYFASHSDSKFSHSICPDCMKDIYGEYFDEDELKKINKKAGNK